MEAGDGLDAKVDWVSGCEMCGFPMPSAWRAVNEVFRKHIQGGKFNHSGGVGLLWQDAHTARHNGAISTPIWPTCHRQRVSRLLRGKRPEFSDGSERITGSWRAARHVWAPPSSPYPHHHGCFPALCGYIRGRGGRQRISPANEASWNSSTTSMTSSGTA